MEKGWEGGGTETPLMLVEFLQHHWGPIWAEWERDGLGFHLPGDAPGSWERLLVALNWADNLWWCSNSLETGLQMFGRLSLSLYGGMQLRWKRSSLKILRVVPQAPSTAGRPPGDLSAIRPGSLVPMRRLGGGEDGFVEVDFSCSEAPFRFTFVPHLDVLGVRVTSSADTRTMQLHRDLGATVSFAKKRALLTSKVVPLTKRVDGLGSLVEAGYLYGCEAWRPSRVAFLAARGACLGRLRTTCRLWRRGYAAESEGAKNWRTLAVIRRLLVRMGQEPAYLAWLRRYHRAAGKTARGLWNGSPSPAQRLLRYRSREWQATFKAAARYSSGRTEVIGHLTFGQPGGKECWEDPLAQCFGPAWMKVAVNTQEWRPQEDYFLRWAITVWHCCGDMSLIKARHGATGLLEPLPSPVTIAEGSFVRISELERLGASVPGELGVDASMLGDGSSWPTFGIIGDSLSGVQAVNGLAKLEVSDRELSALLSKALECLLGVWDRWAVPAWPLEGWALWRKRHLNAAADLLAGWAGRSTTSACCRWGSLDPRLCRRIWAWFDGSLRQGTGALGVVVACWGEDETGLPATAWLEAEMVGASLEDITLLEAQAFSKAAQRVADFHNGG